MHVMIGWYVKMPRCCAADLLVRRGMQRCAVVLLFCHVCWPFNQVVPACCIINCRSAV